MRADPDFRGDPSGCTAVSMIVTSDLKLICVSPSPPHTRVTRPARLLTIPSPPQANAGDSRAVMSVKGEAVALSEDHKPTNQGENARIVAAGGFVEFGRVNGNLALSRALGDFEFKQSSTLSPETQIVTADPEITIHEHTDEDEFVVVACDGIWDVFSSQQVIDFVRRGIAEKKELATISEELMDRCLAPDSDWGGVGCDNMTAMVVAIKGNRTKEEWYNWIADKVKAEPPTAVFDPFAQGPRGGAAGGGRAPGSLSQALSRQGGAGAEDGEEGEDDAAISLPMLQAALRAQGLQIRVAGQGEELGEEDDESEDETMEGEAKVEEIEEVDVRDQATA